MLAKKEALKNRPKRPANAYFKTRLEKFKEYGEDCKDKPAKFKIFWTELPQNKKQELQKLFKQSMEEWKELDEKWQKKYNISTQDLKEMRKAKKQEKQDGKSKSKSRGKPNRSPSKSKGASKLPADSGRQNSKDDKKKPKK